MAELKPEEAEIIRPQRTSAASGLAAAVLRMPDPVFAIVDGGHFDDLPANLAAAGLQARSLFLGHGERDVERHGPWLVPMNAPQDVGTVLALVGDLPAVVFWSCPEGDVALYGHLRRLNMARIPTWAAAGKDGPEPGNDADRGYETVLFRHWDPSVLGALLPALDEAQFARVMGPAQEIVFDAADLGGRKRVVFDPAWPIMPAGMLTIRADQITALVGMRAEARRVRTVRYLRDVTHPELLSATDDEVRRHVLHSEMTGTALGLRTEAGHCRWTYLVYATRGRIVDHPEITTIIKHPGRTPDQQVEGLMDATIDALRTSSSMRQV